MMILAAQPGVDGRVIALSGGLVLAGVNVEAMRHAPDDFGLQRINYVRQATGATAVVRFIAECIPQIFYALDFVEHRKLDGYNRVMVLASMTLSFCFAAKTAIEGLEFCCGEEQE